MVEVYRGKTTEAYLDWYKNKPQEILIETVGLCNFKCLGCPQSLPEYRKQKSKPAFMDFDLYTSILNQVKALWPPINVGLYHTGEITLLPRDKFDLYTKTAKHYLPDRDGWDSVGFFTNGLLLDEQKRELIVKNGINWVKLSFDGGNKETYEKVRIGGHFETVYENAIELAKLVKASGSKTRLQVMLVPFKENENHLREFYKLWEGTGWVASSGGTMNFGGLMEEKIKIRKHKLQFNVRERYSIPCPRVFEQVSVLASGKVSLCCADPAGQVVLGDLTKQSIKEVFYGKTRQAIIYKHKVRNANTMSPCHVCDYTQYCAVPQGEFFGENRR